MTIINMEDLSKIREKYKDKKIVFCSGGFDLTHVGHILFFEDCKKLGDILVVGVARDVSLKKRKGNDRPILNEHIRIKTIDSIKPVNYVFMSSSASTKDLLETIQGTFEKLHPDVYAINEDTFDIPLRRNLCVKFKIKMQILHRSCPKEFDGISTSKIINKIKKLLD